MPESEDQKEPEKVSNNDLRNAQFGGGFINANTVNVQHSGGNVCVLGRQESAFGRQLSRQESRNRQALLAKVRHDWVKGFLEKSLYNQVLIELHLEERPNAVDNPWNHLVDEGQKLLPQGTKVIDVFDQIGEGRTLLILGEPGAGKTITLLQLTRDLIERAKQDVDHPIPVVFNLSSWMGEKQEIADWLVKELKTKYQVPESIGETYLKEQELILLLDGFDEVQGKYQDKCVEVLKAFHQEYNLIQIVVCSRTKDYETLSKPLNFQKAVYLKLLTLQQINDYLNSIGSNVTSLRTLIERDAGVQELAKTPLMLYIMSLIYQGVSVEKLPKTDLIEEYRKHLFNTYIDKMIDKMFQRRTGKQRYLKSQVKRWLTWLAQRMHQESQTVFYIEKIQPLTWLPQSQHQNYKICFLFFYWLLIYLLYLPYIGLFINNQSIVFFLYLFLFFISLFEKKLESIKTVEKLNFNFIKILRDIKDWFKFLRKFLVVSIFIFGSLFGIFIIMSSWLSGFHPIEKYIKMMTKKKKLDSLTYFLTSFLFFIAINVPFILFVIVEPFFIITGWVMQLFFYKFFKRIFLNFIGSEIEEKTFPNQGIKQSVVNTVITALITCIIYGVMAGLIANIITADLNLSLIYGLTFGLSYGFGFGIDYGGGKACIQHFMLRLMLYCNNFIPWNYARFLDYAVECIFLQKVGGGYIFIHRLLQDHFAQMEFTHPK